MNYELFGFLLNHKFCHQGHKTLKVRQDYSMERNFWNGNLMLFTIYFLLII